MKAILVLDDINLSQFDRLSSIASSYQSFRITRVDMRFKPYTDTFQNNGPTGEAVPYLHYLVDKGENLVPSTFNQLRDSGAKPIRFDDKTITVSWKPRVPQATAADSTATPTLSFAMNSQSSPWLPTNSTANLEPSVFLPSTVPHKGLYYGVEQAYTNGDVSRFYGVEITVHAQFRKPLFVVALDNYVPPTKKKITAD